MFFPDNFPKQRNFELISKVKERDILILETLLKADRQKQKRIDDINDQLKSSIIPKDLRKLELSLEKDFEESCIQLARFANEPVHKMSTKAFYTMIQMIKSKKLQIGRW